MPELEMVGAIYSPMWRGLAREEVQGMILARKKAKLTTAARTRGRPAMWRKGSGLGGEAQGEGSQQRRFAGQQDLARDTWSRWRCRTGAGAASHGGALTEKGKNRGGSAARRGELAQG